MESTGKQAEVLAALWVLPVEAPPVADGAVVVRGGCIAWVGRRVDLPAEFRAARARGYPHGLILPGFVNAHCHLSLTAMLGRLRGTADGFVDWIRALLRERAGWTAEIAQRSTAAGLDLLAARGVTTVGEMAAQPSPEVFLAHRLRAVLFLEIISFTASGAGAATAAAARRLDGLQEAIAEAPRLTVGLAPHAPYTISAPLLRRLAELARKRGLPVAIHLAETRAEREFLLRGGGEFEALLRERGAWDERWRPPGVSPVRLAADAGLLERPGSAIHLNYLDEEDLALLARGRLVPVYCPGSHRWFGHAAHPAPRLLAAGLPLALGTDSLASHTALDMLAEVRLAAATFSDIPCETWLRAATLWAARALALDDETGSLIPGKAADLVVLESREPPGADPHAALLHADLKLRLAMVDGEKVAPARE